MHLSDLVASSAYRIDNLIRSRFFYFVRVNLHSIYEHLKVKRAARHSYIVILKQYYGVDLSRMYFAIAHLFGSGKLIFSDAFCRAVRTGLYAKKLEQDSTMIIGIGVSTKSEISSHGTRASIPLGATRS